jgi:hypothetical protein
LSLKTIPVAEFSEADYAHAVLQMLPGCVCFERGLELQLLRLAVHEVLASDKASTQEDRVFSLKALLGWILFAGIEMQRNHSLAQEKAC